MTIFATALLISATAAAADGPDISPGPVGEFFSFQGAAPSDTAPGSFSSYVSTNSVRIPNMWRIVREGVVTNVPQPTVEDTPDGFRFYFGDSHAPGETISSPYSNTFDNPDPIFDLGWTAQFGTTNVGYRAHGTNFIDKPLGMDLYRLRTTRPNLESYSDLVATFEAYYERLYYASQGQSNAWDRTKWGTTDKGPEFNLGVTNGLAHRHFDYINLPCVMTNNAYVSTSTNVGRRIGTARLQEHPNVYGIREELKRVLGGNHGQGDRQHFAGAVFRPGWVTYDKSSFSVDDFDYGTFNPCFWWSSTLLFPGNENTRVVPEFDWRSVVVTSTNSHEWSDHAATFEMMDYGGFDFPSGGQNPLRELVRQSVFHSREDNIPPHDFSGTAVEDAITNVFWNSARSRIANDPMMTYAKTWYDPAGHLLRPEPVAGMNQLLSMMDRTLHMPLVSTSASYVNVSVLKLYTIMGWAEFDVGVYDRGTDKFGARILGLIPDESSTTNIVTRDGLWDYSHAVLAVSGTGYGNLHGAGTIPVGNEYTLDFDSCFDAVIDLYLQGAFTNGFNFIEVTPSIAENEFSLTYVSAEGYTYNQNIGIVEPPGTCYVYCIYDPFAYYDYTDHTNVTATSGPFQPGVDASRSGRVKSSHFGALSTIMTTDSDVNSSYRYDSYMNFHGWSYYNQTETPEIFKTSVYDYDAQNFEQRLSGCMRELFEKEQNMFRNRFGSDYNDHDALIPSPPLPDENWSASLDVNKCYPERCCISVYVTDDGEVLVQGITDDPDLQVWYEYSIFTAEGTFEFFYDGSPILTRPDFCAHGKFSAITQVDWKWKNMSIKEDQ